MSTPPAVPLLRLLLALLDHQHRLDDERRKEETARSERRCRALQVAREKIIAMAKERGTEMTEAEANIAAAGVLDIAVREQAEEQMVRGEGPLVDMTPWNQAVSFLFQAMTVPCADERDPAVECGKEQRRWFEPSDDENRLREHLLRVRVGGVEGTSPLSRELARLDNADFGNHLANHLRQYFPAEMAAILGAINTPAAGHGRYRLEETNNTTWLVWGVGGAEKKKAVSIPQFGLLEAMRAAEKRPKEEVLHELRIDNEQNYDALQLRLNRKLKEWGVPFHFRVVCKEICVIRGAYEPKKGRQKKRQSGRQKRQKSRQ
jgi:hypothetical protein